jgi:uncharacterized protein (DUF885 family)
MKFQHLPVTVAIVLAALVAPDPTFDTWAEGVAADLMRASPMQATSAQYFEGAEQDALDRRLTPITKAWRAERLAQARRVLAELARFDRSRLDPQQRVSAAGIEWATSTVVASDAFADFTFVFNQFGGLHVRLVNFLSQTHPIRTRRDIENYLARLDLVSAQIDDGIALAKEAAQRGFLMPTFITNSSLGQLERFLADPPAKNVLVTSLDERAAKLTDLSARDRATFVAAAEKTVTQSVIPAFKRAQALLQEQLPRTNDHAGLCWLPGGDKAYANALRRFTTTDYTPQQIHEIGLREVARIEAEMDGVFRTLRYTEGTINERYRKLNLDSQPPADPDPRAGLIAEYTTMLRDAERRARLVFDITPKAAIEVRREPPFTEKTAAAHYTAPSRDRTRPGVFWAPLPGPTFNIIGMRTLVYHEGVPGHHFQIATQQETESLPRYRRDGLFGGGSAYSEGWALYAEQLATENNWYDGDPKGRLGQLNAELFRARRLVVDTGLHAMKWTRQQAIDYGISAQEVERYVMNPGQACAYKIGQLKILEIRAKAKRRLGAGFDIRKFHNVVLQTGNVSLAVLEQVVDDWVKSQP